jgi:hypothetical protein
MMMQEWQNWINESSYDLKRLINAVLSGDSSAMHHLSRLALREPGEASEGFLQALLSTDHYLMHPAALSALFEMDNDPQFHDAIMQVMGREDLPNDVARVWHRYITPEMFRAIWQMNMPMIRDDVTNMLSNAFPFQDIHDASTNHECDIRIEGFVVQYDANVYTPEDIEYGLICKLGTFNDQEGIIFWDIVPRSKNEYINNALERIIEHVTGPDLMEFSERVDIPAMRNALMLQQSRFERLSEVLAQGVV